MRTNTYTLLLTVVALGVVAGGCATKKYVRAQVETAETRTDERVAGVESMVEDNQESIAVNDQEIDRLSDETAELSRTAQDALDRAIAAGKLAEGKFLYETILNDDSVRFGFDKADLSSEAKAALDAFSGDLIGRDEGVFIEIQGHTDATGSDEYNLVLGERRAGSVLRYLNSAHGLPLHRMSAISYGEAAPLAENDNRDSRAQNRRVALVVLK